MKIVFADQSTLTMGDIDLAPITALGAYTGWPNSTASELLARVADADILLVNKSPVGRAALDAAPQLKLVSVTATGYNNVDLAAAAARRVLVCNVPGYATASVAQHTFALILNLATRAFQYHNDVRDGAWQRAASFTLLTHPTFELAGKTIGIIGYGAIGRAVARIARAFDMTVLVHTRGSLAEPGIAAAGLDRLLRQADVLTIHCPLTERTRNLIDADALAKMKPDAILVNTARGGIVDETALADALNRGRIAAAAVDVLTEEPPARGNPLLTARNIIITPHTAWSTVQARQRLVNQTAANIRAFLAGAPRNIVPELPL
jgi:glycerate dehydrogenase